MRFYIHAVHHRNLGKHCVNLLFSPDAECRAFSLNAEQGTGGGCVGSYVYGRVVGYVVRGEEGRERQTEAKRGDVIVPERTESPSLTQSETIKPSLQLEICFSLT